jgi:hypothetical protein
MAKMMVVVMMKMERRVNDQPRNNGRVRLAANKARARGAQTLRRLLPQ